MADTAVARILLARRRTTLSRFMSRLRGFSHKSHVRLLGRCAWHRRGSDTVTVTLGAFCRRTWVIPGDALRERQRRPSRARTAFTVVRLVRPPTTTALVTGAASVEDGWRAGIGTLRLTGCAGEGDGDGHCRRRRVHRCRRAARRRPSRRARWTSTVNIVDLGRRPANLG
jgi:hypothetical protein